MIVPQNREYRMYFAYRTTGSTTRSLVYTVVVLCTQLYAAVDLPSLPVVRLLDLLPFE